MTDALELAGQRALAEMTRLWAMDIIDPPRGSKHPRAVESLAVINEIIRVNGWGDGHSYLGNGPPQWCGMTAGYAWSKAGLDPRLLSVWFASTMRLIAWASYHSWNEHRNPAPAAAEDRRHCIPLTVGRDPRMTPRSGDIVIVGDGRDKWGQHVTLCHEWDSARRVVSTLSGNGSGLGPKGDKREGISAMDFAIDATSGYRAMWIIRPAFGDLLAERPA